MGMVINQGELGNSTLDNHEWIQEELWCFK